MTAWHIMRGDIKPLFRYCPTLIGVAPHTWQTADMQRLTHLECIIVGHRWGTYVVYDVAKYKYMHPWEKIVEHFLQLSTTSRLHFAMDPSWCSDFPQDPLLVKLLEASRSTTDTIVHDENGLKKSYPELLGDILKTRDAIRKSIPPSSMDNLGMLRPEAPYIGFLALSGYEFLVAFFACRAIGGACMPFGKVHYEFGIPLFITNSSAHRIWHLTARGIHASPSNRSNCASSWQAPVG